MRVIVCIFSAGNQLAELVLKLRTAHRFGFVVESQFLRSPSIFLRIVNRNCGRG
jgi:hypothetical protein